jgi:hypothetical protein
MQILINYNERRMKLDQKMISAPTMIFTYGQNINLNR